MLRGVEAGRRAGRRQAAAAASRRRRGGMRSGASGLFPRAAAAPPAGGFSLLPHCPHRVSASAVGTNARSTILGCCCGACCASGGLVVRVLPAQRWRRRRRSESGADMRMRCRLVAPALPFDLRLIPAASARLSLIHSRRHTCCLSVKASERTPRERGIRQQAVCTKKQQGKLRGQRGGSPSASVL